MRLRGLDHVEIRVSSLARVEPFYDRVLPALGRTRKVEAHVDDAGTWHDVDATHPRTAIEYHASCTAGTLAWFVGCIEETCVPHATRIAFALETEADSPLVDYHAPFFEDPTGTRLEICARRASACSVRRVVERPRRPTGGRDFSNVGATSR